MKFTKDFINTIREYTPQELKGQQLRHTNAKELEELGTYQKQNTNWNYKILLVEYNNNAVVVITRFGEIL